MPASLQDILDASRQAFIVENRPPAYEVDDGCCYRTPDGRCCSFGLVIPNGHPCLDVIEGGPASSVVERYPELFDQTLSGLTEDELDDIQSTLHDGLAKADPTTDRAEWTIDVHERDAHYAEFARQHNLRYERVYPEGAAD